MLLSKRSLSNLLAISTPLYFVFRPKPRVCIQMTGRLGFIPIVRDQPSAALKGYVGPEPVERDGDPIAKIVDRQHMKG